MAALYDLSFKPRGRIGIRRKDYTMASLLENRSGSKQEGSAASPIDVYASPISSSDEASIAGDEEEVKVAIAPKGNEGPSIPKTKNSLEMLSPNEESPSKDFKSETDSATFRTITSSSTDEPRNSNDIQNSPKRKNIIKDDEDEDDPMGLFTGSQSKRRKIGYGSSSQPPPVNVHTKGSTEGKKKPLKKEAATSQKTGKNGFRTVDPGAMANALDKLEGKARGATWHQPPSSLSSSRSQTASQRSSKGTQESSQGDPSTTYKRPPKLPPKKKTPTKPKAVPQFRSVAQTNSEENPGRVTRSSKLTTKPSAFGTEKDTEEPALKDALSTATEKLGLPEIQFKSVTPRTTQPLALSNSTNAEESVIILSSPIDEEDTLYLDQAETENLPSLCPLCKEPVDKTFLEEASAVGQRLSIRQQTAFCRAHKRRKADAEWQKRQYPNINWQNLKDRLEKHHSKLEDILKRRNASFYRNAFEDLMKKRNDRTWKQALMNGEAIEDTSTGYYGTRGAKIMSVNLFPKFFSKKSDGLHKGWKISCLGSLAAFDVSPPPISSLLPAVFLGSCKRYWCQS